MRYPIVVLGLVVWLGGLAIPATAGPTVTPRPGNYQGPKFYPHVTVPKSLTKVTNIGANVPAAKTCHLNHGGGQFPINGSAPLKDGAFTKVQHDYPAPSPRVRISGHFVSPTEIKGHETVHYTVKKYVHCDRVTAYTMTRQG